jgi:hypothetical protein
MAYTSIDDPSAYFQIALYTGNGTGQTITNDGNSDLQPDFLWFKNRDETVANILWDSSRGITKFLISEQTAADQTNPAGYELTSFNTDGFGLGIHNTAGINQSSSFTYVCWQWKANGGTTTAFSESGSNPGGTRQTNTAAGFSIIAYTGTGSNGTIAHGLPSTPEFLIFKRRDAAQFWCVWHQAIGDDYKLALHLTAGLDADGAFMASTLPTSTNITVGGASVNTNADNGTYICYAFSPVQGYSKFGSYVGNGNANGPFIYTGFKPAWVMIKNTSINGNWYILDAKRSPSNLVDKQLQANGNGAESTSPAYFSSDFLSNGFKLKTNEAQSNNSGNTYIYMAFAENPFVTSTGIPTTAR